MTTQVVKTRPTRRLTLKDRLSRLTFDQACKLLGPRGRSLIQKSSNLWEIKIEEDIFLGNDLFRLSIREKTEDGSPIVVSITLMAEVRDRLHWSCSHCQEACEHAGAAFSLILEEKTALGLAAPPQPRVPIESMGEDELVAKALAERAVRARVERMKVQAADPDKPWTDYSVTNKVTGKTYRVALRGMQPGDSYCSCPDFRSNTLGTCKHVMHVQTKVKRRFTDRELKKPYRRKHLALHLRY